MRDILIGAVIIGLLFGAYLYWKVIFVLLLVAGLYELYSRNLIPTYSRGVNTALNHFRNASGLRKTSILGLGLAMLAFGGYYIHHLAYSDKSPVIDTHVTKQPSTYDRISTKSDKAEMEKVCEEGCLMMMQNNVFEQTMDEYFACVRACTR